MIKAKTDFVRTELLRETDAGKAENDRVTQQQKDMATLLLSDWADSKSAGQGQKSPASKDGGLSSQRKRLDGRRRSRELEALLYFDGEVRPPEEPQLDDVADVQVSQEERYWQDMWHMAKATFESRWQMPSRRSCPLARSKLMDQVPSARQACNGMHAFSSTDSYFVDQIDKMRSSAAFHL
ncbi:Uncharacterized protein SCF082_LOCUS30144 [Durusdinium trenchii]|uniref:Uncharacterized protein n=1 Tax=Durusdinium trenchii TaxID=1381693 RepID=A0ABP0MYA6_9DINO